MVTEPINEHGAEHESHRQWLRETRAFYDRVSRLYDAMSDHYEGQSRRVGVEMLDAREGEALMEIGFGTGHALIALAEGVGSSGIVFGVDASMGMVCEGRKRVETAGLANRIGILQGDALRLPLRDNCLSGIFMSFVLELFSDAQRAAVLSECRRVLAPKGRLAVVALSKGDHSKLVVSLYEWLHEKFPHFIDCRPIQVRQSLEIAGFGVLKQESGEVWKLPVEIVLGRKE